MNFKDNVDRAVFIDWLKSRNIFKRFLRRCDNGKIKWSSQSSSLDKEYRNNPIVLSFSWAKAPEGSAFWLSVAIDWNKFLIETQSRRGKS